VTRQPASRPSSTATACWLGGEGDGRTPSFVDSRLASTLPCGASAAGPEADDAGGADSSWRSGRTGIHSGGWQQRLLVRHRGSMCPGEALARQCQRDNCRSRHCQARGRRALLAASRSSSTAGRSAPPAPSPLRLQSGHRRRRDVLVDSGQSPLVGASSSSTARRSRHRAEVTGSFRAPSQLLSERPELPRGRQRAHRGVDNAAVVPGTLGAPSEHPGEPLLRAHVELGLRARRCACRNGR